MSVRWAGTWVGRWLVDGELARGGSGLVLCARDPRTGERAALKLLVGARTSEVARARFVREVEVLRRVDHPHLVRLLDAGEHQGTPWLAMELLPGPTLAERLEREGSLPIRDALEVARALLGGLEALHQAGVVHRDLKPANVGLDAQGQPRLLDLGLARDLDPQATQLSRTGVFMGTPGYMAPEQATGDLRAIGPATDVWGLGATLHALLTGQAPHGDTAHPLEAARGRPVEPPSRRRPGVSPAIDAFVLRCLQPDPAARFSSAAAARDALEALFRGGRAVRGGPARVHVALAVGVLLLGMGSAALLLGHGPAREPAPAPRPGRGPPADGSTTPSPEVVAARADAQLELARARGLSASGDRAGALSAVERALALERSAEALFLRADLRADQDPPGALADLDAALALDPDHLLALGRRALLRFGQEDLTGALADCDRLVGLKPDDALPWSNRGQLRLAAGDAQGALRDLDRALELAPDDFAALRSRGGAWATLGDPAQAAADMVRSLELDHSELATVTRRNLEALRAKVAQAASQHGGLTPYGLISRGQMKVTRHDMEGALADYTAALTQDPAQVDGWVLRSGLLGLLGRPERAAADAARAIALAPDNPAGWQHRGITRLLLRDPAGALLDLTHALELDPTRGPCSFHRALALSALGRLEEAAAELERFLTLQPDGDDAARARVWIPGLRAGRPIDDRQPGR